MEASSPSSLIDPAHLHSLLGEARGRFSVEAIAECESTNTLLFRRAEQGAVSGHLIVCDRQTAGRGSRGRRWAASPEASLTFSLLWRFECPLSQMSGLSLGVGLAVVRALADCGVHGVTLKWPNDILYRDAKLGGILVELSADADMESSHPRAVIGIGLNLRLPALSGHESELMMTPTALDAVVSTPPDRHRLLACLMVRLAEVFDDFARAGFLPLREAWMAHHAWQGRPVRVLREGRVEKEGVCRGADDDGALLIETAAGLERCLSGDVSLRVVS